MTRFNVHICLSPFKHETRVLRITKSLGESNVFDSIMVIAALRDKNLLQRENIDDHRKVWRIPTLITRRGTISKAINAVEWSIRALIYLSKRDIACINAHSIAVLPLAVFVKLFKKCKLVYDAHEIETETTQLSGLRKTLTKFVERILINFVDVIALTSFGHADWYKRTYKLNNIKVVRNHPYYREQRGLSKNSILKDKFGILKDELLFIYQGAIEKPRGIYLIMKVFARLPKNRHIVFMGYGSDIPSLMNYVKQHENIHYFPAVPPDQVFFHTSSADVGIHMMDNSCTNHLYALPNKPMEYMNAGIPAIVTDLPEMSRLIREAGAGWIVPVGDDKELESLILSLDRDDILRKSEKAVEWANNHYWEKEEELLIKMYETLGFNHRREK